MKLTRKQLKSFRVTKTLRISRIKIANLLNASKANESKKKMARAKVMNENELEPINELGFGSFGLVVKMKH